MKVSLNSDTKSVEEVTRRTSFSVFLSFVKPLASGGICVKGILSARCFNQWVLTRKARVKHPKDSFRRTLLAHIRCCDGRQPFPKNVETGLSNILRTEPNPWEFLYGGGRSKRTRRSVQMNSAYGYHERQIQGHKKVDVEQQMDIDLLQELLKEAVRVQTEEILQELSRLSGSGINLFSQSNNLC